MRAALLLVVFSLLSVMAATGPAGAEDWIALWLIGDDFLGMTENGEVYRYIHSTGEVEYAGSFGAGTWVSFGRRNEQLLALKSDGEVWAMPGSGGATVLYRNLPADREWCALQQHPDVEPFLAISCDGEIWGLYEPPQMLADIGAYASGRWICIANADDSYFATLENGETWQGYEGFEQAGTYGPGPWVGFSRTYGAGGNFVALNPSGEIWAHGWGAPPSLFLALPAGREWCAMLTGPTASTGPGYALTCDGEIWSVESPSVFVGSFAPPTLIEERSWGSVKAAWR